MSFEFLDTTTMAAAHANPWTSAAASSQIDLVFMPFPRVAGNPIAPARHCFFLLQYSRSPARNR
jgi:hypothetical protein